jgi:hypothetical protein
MASIPYRSKNPGGDAAQLLPGDGMSGASWPADIRDAAASAEQAFGSSADIRSMADQCAGRPGVALHERDTPESRSFRLARAGGDSTVGRNMNSTPASTGP